jgi:DNA polymerase III subunit beta
MKLTLNTSELAKCLDIVEKALPTRTTMPAINNILFHINHDHLSFSTTNLQMYIKTMVQYDGSDSKTILLPPKIIEIIRSFPTDTVELVFNWDNYRIDISGGSAHFHLYGAEAEDYPATFNDLPIEKNILNVDKTSLKKLLKETIFTASNEESRPAFNGIYFEFCSNSISITASDTYRLTVKNIINSSWSLEEKNCLVPARTMKELLRILDDSSGSIDINYLHNMIIFNFNDIIFASRLLEEKYPDVSGVIPGEYKTRVYIDGEAFENTISRASLLTEGKNQAVNLEVSDNKLETRVSSQVGSMEESISVQQVGENVALFINSRFILDFLKILNRETIIIDFHGEGGPVIFRIPDDDSYLYLVLPIKKIN